MANMSMKKTPMPQQDAAVRARNFAEVALGYTEAMAREEAARCLNCKNRPCVAGCPVNVAIPEFIAKVAEGDFEAAYEVITRTNSLPAVCGRVCPQENQCESKCVRGIKGEPVAIGRLERFEPTGTWPTAVPPPSLLPKTATAVPSSAPALPASPVPATLPGWATASPCLKPSMWPAAC